MNTDGRIYKTIVVSKPDKYTDELKERIEELGSLCLNNLNQDDYHPIMMLGSIQSGKTRAFIGLMALCFDNDFDMTIILTKCSKALVQQTVSRMMAEFAEVKSGKSNIGDVVAQNILDIDFGSETTEAGKQKIVRQFLKRYPEKKRIIVVKKQADNVDRMIRLINEIVASNKYKRILIVDDEADITSIGYEGKADDLTLRRVSGAVNTARKNCVNSEVRHVLMQVTATPYALYLQPDAFSNEDIMPIKPERTVVLPTGQGYIGGKYYFMDSQDEYSDNYHKAMYLPYIVPQEEMDLLNGTKKNSGKNIALTDKRVVKPENFLELNGAKYALPTLRKWIFDVLVGTAIIQLQEGCRDYYVSAVMHASINKKLHKHEKDFIENGFDIIRRELERDIDSSLIKKYLQISYADLAQSVKAYNVINLPSMNEVARVIAYKDEDGDLEGIITEVDIKEVNSDKDIEKLLDANTGELKLENSLTIFVGGQVLDRGITIPSLISFFYGRDPKQMQQDTVMQHCRMFGYRSENLLSVTRFYTTARLLNNMTDIMERDCILRERMQRQKGGSVVYLESGNKIIACSKVKIAASDIKTILPEKRYLPVGFTVKRTTRLKNKIDEIVEELHCSKQTDYKKGLDIDDSMYLLIDKDKALELLRYCYDMIEPDQLETKCSVFADIESPFLFSTSQCDKVALLVRRNRQIGMKKKRGNTDTYQDAPDDGNNEGLLAKNLRDRYPVLVLTEQCNPVWKNAFWWPVYYTPSDMNIGIYAETNANSVVRENVFSASKKAIKFTGFPVINNSRAKVNEIKKIEAAINKIMKFRDEKFKFRELGNIVPQREGLECKVYIDNGSEKPGEDSLLKQIKQLKEKTMEAIRQTSISTDKIKNIDRFYSLLLNNDFSEEVDYLHDKILEELKGYKNRAVAEICKYVDEAFDVLRNSFITLGYFEPKGSGVCEIRIYYDKISNECTNAEARMELLINVIAHEMQHAWHYADTMTKSGRWFYSRKAFLKQGWTQESIAEYFALCYAKKRKAEGKAFAYNNLTNDRDIAQFPKDGGYSGALLIDKEPDMFKDIYLMSIEDMPTAYDKYLKVLKEKYQDKSKRKTSKR